MHTCCRYRGSREVTGCTSSIALGRGNSTCRKTVAATYYYSVDTAAVYGFTKQFSTTFCCYTMLKKQHCPHTVAVEFSRRIQEIEAAVRRSTTRGPWFRIPTMASRACRRECASSISRREERGTMLLVSFWRGKTEKN